MKKTFLAIGIASLMAIATSAYATELRYATGKLDGGYDAFSHQQGERLGQRGYTVNITNYNGSDEITLALCNNKADIGITQIDALDARELEGCTLETAGTYGDGEWAVIMFPPDSDYDELDDFDGTQKVLVDTIGSGSALFWDTIVRIEKGENGNNSDWASSTPVYDEVLLADGLARRNAIDAVIMVRKEGSQDIERLLKRGWEMGELYDKDIDDYEYLGGPLYKGDDYKFYTAGGSTVAEYGYKVESLIVTTTAVKRDSKTFTDIARTAE